MRTCLRDWRRLSSLFPGCIHVRDVGLKQADDREIWRWAKDNDYSLVTTDSDFVAMVKRVGTPPKVIHIERCDFPFRVSKICFAGMPFGFPGLKTTPLPPY